MRGQTAVPQQNPLATAPIGSLIAKFAIPSIVANLVNATYNIVDQIFIGHGVGMLGNAATNVAFPITTIGLAVSLLIGVGSASNFNLEQGRGNRTRATNIAANGISLMAVCGITIAVLVILFLESLMKIFGATENVLPLAMTYTRITTVGIPLVIFTTAFSQLIRADGSPTYSMLCLVSGAVLNTILDPIFIFVFDMGLAGAAWATVLSQALSAFLAIRYLKKFKTVKFKRVNFKLRGKLVKSIAALGAAASFNQLAMTAVQITMNNTLTYYGALSIYGSDIPLAAVGVISKVNVIMMAFTLGISQGCQPILGFNYGAKNYGRVKRTYLRAMLIVTAVSTVAFLCFQLFPRQIVSIFGEGSEEYFLFAERYFRIFMMLIFAVGIQQLSSIFFSSIGKARKGILLSLTRQVILLLPLIIILPRFMGIDGVMYAGPIADAGAILLTLILVGGEFRSINKLQTAGK